MRRPVLAAVLATLVALPRLLGAQTCTLPTQHVVYNAEWPGWTAAAKSAALARMDAVDAVLRDAGRTAAAEGYLPRGVAATSLHPALPYIPPEGPRAPLPSHYALQLFAAASKAPGACALKKNETSAGSVLVVANALGPILEDEKSPFTTIAEPERWYLEPLVVDSVGGFPRYANGTVLVTRTGRAPLEPVSRERWLRAFIAFWRGASARSREAVAEKPADLGAVADSMVLQYDAAVASLEETYRATRAADPKSAATLKATIDKMKADRPTVVANAARTRAAMGGMTEARAAAGGALAEQTDSIDTWVRGAEAALARMSPAERRADAYVGGTEKWQLGPPEPGRRVVRLAPGFFDPTLPRTALQSLAVVSSSASGRYANQEPGNQMADRVLAAVEWAKLAALLGR